MNQPILSPVTGRPASFITKLISGSTFIASFAFMALFACNDSGKAATPAVAKDTVPEVPKPLSDSAMNALNDQLIIHITNGDTSGKWPVKTDYPLPGSILPFKRIISYYGNMYSKNMGILGELPPAQMLEKLKGELAKWQKADSIIPVIPALHYIAVTAQGSPGPGNTYRARMPFKQIDSVLHMAAMIKDAIVFLDIQVGHSTLQQEIPALQKYLAMPNVHLGIDPEFSMKGGQAPGKVIGTFDAADINYASEYLAKLVKDSALPPKILIVHRFTKNMVTNSKQIKLRPEVQMVMDMDGWGGPTLKRSSYTQYIYREPVQFTGFKLFYKNDIKNNNKMMTPEDVLALKPQPVYIQYQ